MPDSARFPPNRAGMPDHWAASFTTGGPSFERRRRLWRAAMFYLVIKAAISGVLAAAAAEIARRYPGWGGLVASLPLTSILAMIWLYRDAGDTGQVAALSGSVFWFVLPSLPMFLVLPALLRSGLGFWISLGLVIVGTLALYATMFWAAPRIGLKI